MIWGRRCQPCHARICAAWRHKRRKGARWSTTRRGARVAKNTPAMSICSNVWLREIFDKADVNHDEELTLVRYLRLCLYLMHCRAKWPTCWPA